jgi:hypothetical protein
MSLIIANIIFTLNLEGYNIVRDIIAVPRAALRATPGHPSDVRRLRAGGTCP